MSDDVRKVAWITGAGSGMGRAAASALADSGWRVALSGRRPSALQETAELIDARGGAAIVVPMDVSRDDPVEAVSRIEAWAGRIDGLVLAAGMNSPRRTWGDQCLDEFDRIVQTNLSGVTRVVGGALPALRASRGVAVVISSYAGWSHQPAAGVAYSASKTALAAVVRTLNAHEAAAGVRACHLCPGDVDTAFLRMRPSVPDGAARAEMLSASDVARAVRFVLDSPSHVRIDELVISPVSQV